MIKKMKSRVGCRRLLCVTFGASLSWSSALSAAESSESLKAKRCATRLSIAITGTAPESSLFTNADPQSQAEQLFATEAFRERFARFINSTFNDEAGATPEEDAPYHLAKYVLENNLRWKDLFVGGYNVVATGMGAARTISVRTDANGLGYFRSPGWVARYAGNELQGLKIATVYRMINNTTGLDLSAVTTAPGADISANGRAAPACRKCHFENWYALDKNAALLDRRVPMSNPPRFIPADGQPKEVLDGKMLRNDKEFVQALVESPDFSFNACRLAFSFLYGRPENACEGAVFDSCLEAFKVSGSIVNALTTIAKEPSFCQ
jgi:hypothetical protein